MQKHALNRYHSPSCKLCHSSGKQRVFSGACHLWCMWEGYVGPGLRGNMYLKGVCVFGGGGGLGVKLF